MVLTLATVLATGCGGGSAGAPVKLSGTTNNHGTKPAKDALEVEADDFYFGPTFVTAAAGQAFTVELVNNGSARHTFTSEAMGIDIELPPGAKRTVTLHAPPSGFSEFHCKFHQGQGMQGAVYVK